MLSDIPSDGGLRVILLGEFIGVFFFLLVTMVHILPTWGGRNGFHAALDGDDF